MRAMKRSARLVGAVITVASLPPTIEGLLERGYEFVRVDDMFCREPTGLVGAV